jgi:hypothetical protein
VKDNVRLALPGASIEYEYLDRNPEPSGAGVEEWRPRQESQVYVYRIVQSGDHTAVEVTLEAMRHGDATGISGCIVEAQGEGPRGRARVEWRADRLVILWSRT